jgi:D-alanyl-D-alanine carboxypeptidase
VFQQALWSGRLLSPQTLQALLSFDGVFRQGIHYGKGMMQPRFGEFFFLLGAYPKMVGHMGSLATHMFYDPVRDLHVILTLGTDAAMEDSVKLIISMVGVALRIKGGPR